MPDTDSILQLQLLSIRQVADLEGASKSSIYSRLNNGEYEGLRDGNRTLITLASVQRRREGLAPYVPGGPNPNPKSKLKRSRGRRFDRALAHSI